MRRVWLLVCVVAAVTAFACAKSSAIRDAGIDELHDALGKPGTVLVNVHLDSDIKSKTTFIAGEIHVPVDALRQRLDQIPKDANVYLVSDDYHDVVTAANILADAGYPFVYRVTAGFAAYRSKYPAK